MSYKDRTFCASPNCKNECGRKMTEQENRGNTENQLVSYGYFCGEPEHPSIFDMLKVKFDGAIKGLKDK